MKTNNDIGPLPRPTIGFSDLRLDFPESVVLSNGIPLTVVGDGEDDVSRLSILIHAGTFEEDLLLTATATAQALYEGTSRHTADEMAELLDRNGAFQTSQAYDHRTVTTLSTLNDTLRDVLPVAVEALDDAAFRPEDVEQHLRRLRANCELALRRVKYLSTQEVKRLYYGDGHPLAANPMPTDVDALNADVLRDFHRRYFHVDNCLLIIAGKVTDRELAIVDDTFGHWQRRGDATVERTFTIQPSATSESVIHVPDAVQASISMAIKGIPRRHPDYFNLRILTTVLGGYFGSRLMANIRERKGLTYGIGASLLGREDNAMVGIGSECDTANTRQVIDEINAELRTLREERIPQHELNTVKQYMLSDLAKSLDTPFSIASTIANRWLHGTYPEYFNRQVEAINNVTPDDLIETARRYYTDDNTFLAIACDRDKLK